MNKTVIGIMYTATLVFAFALSASAQTVPEQKPPATPPVAPPVSPCPKLELHSTTPGPVKDGRPVKFMATLTGGDQKVIPIFIWSTTAGSIITGQGTPNIDVDSSGAGADKAITASILIGGFPPECTADASFTIPVAGPAKKLEEYGSIKDGEEAPRLDGFAANVTTSDQAYIIVYAGRTSPRGHANTELRRIRAYLVKAGVTADRIGAIDGGYKEEISHELWLVPIGADAPRPSPTVSAKEIVFPKTQPVTKKP